jgi:general nucleoside transport system permease protein
MSEPTKPLPRWADVAVLPLLNVGAAFVISGLVVAAIGESPWKALQLLIGGALGDLEGIGFTLYYATSFIFTGLAVAVCFHAGLFNIGVELHSGPVTRNCGHHRVRGVRRRIRCDSGLSPGQAR